MMRKIIYKQSYLYKNLYSGQLCLSPKFGDSSSYKSGDLGVKADKLTESFRIVNWIMIFILIKKTVSNINYSFKQAQKQQLSVLDCDTS